MPGGGKVGQQQQEARARILAGSHHDFTCLQFLGSQPLNGIRRPFAFRIVAETPQRTYIKSLKMH